MNDLLLVFIDAMNNGLNEVPLKAIAEEKKVEPVRTPYPCTAAFRLQYIVPVDRFRGFGRRTFRRTRFGKPNRRVPL